MNWKKERVLIIGAARQGTALARYLYGQGAEVVLTDLRSAEDLAEERQSLADCSIEWVLGEHPINLLEKTTLICPSGGVPLSIPILVEAIKQGREDIYDLLRTVPQEGAKTFHEALQSFRILHFALWASGNYHNTIGRFDQYMLKYLEHDLQNGILDHDSALELLEEFFLSFNKDSDLYPGMQQGDNGQSMVLGGITKKGEEGFNHLSEMCLKASYELKVIDPDVSFLSNPSASHDHAGLPVAAIV